MAASATLRRSAEGRHSSRPARKVPQASYRLRSLAGVLQPSHFVSCRHILSVQVPVRSGK